MEANFWQQKWKKNEIGFHEEEVNPGLIKHFSKLELSTGSRMFVPLCGKTLDISWLLEQGYRVVGAELSELAIQQLFAQLKMTPDIQPQKNAKHYRADNIDIFVGDIFELNADMLGNVDGIYDRAALVALPRDVRHRYSAHLRALTNTAPQLLIAFNYDQQRMDGPPFAVTPEEVEEHYADYYSLTLLQDSPVKGGLKGQCKANSNIWLLGQGE
ncbi:thiopurine S-methyltransferase [Alteromonas pelagimontana]|uniref:Thiopurine S-methyltransferase n=1 Tax=Alteromonas pelagimontana TaxID=1858656 RepID=A0A6M4MBA9_9ALTE|nr:thiopurine S-methyltransferase [Alteromonas pelagimontana]QJR80317.1 thiopurine S-methyltransferase [Alteromonas pelagimontana]